MTLSRKRERKIQEADSDFVRALLLSMTMDSTTILMAISYLTHLYAAKDTQDHHKVIREFTKAVLETHDVWFEMEGYQDTGT